MTETIQTQAERAALVQRFQLDALNRALQSLESHLDALESESRRQRDELSHLERKLADLRDKLDLPRPSDQAPTDSPDEGRAPTIDRTPPAILPPPDPGEHWDGVHSATWSNTSPFTGSRSTRDPLEQLLPPHRAAEIRRRFDTELRPAPWDRWDYGVVALAVIGGAAHGLPARRDARRESFKGEPQRESPLTAWMKEQSKKLAPMSGR